MPSYLKYITLTLALSILSSCKRDRICHCTSPSLAVAHHYKTTMAEADKKCAEYEQELHQSGNTDMVCGLRKQAF